MLIGGSKKYLPPKQVEYIPEEKKGRMKFNCIRNKEVILRHLQR
jgi:hypothetical protein